VATTSTSACTCLLAGVIVSVCGASASAQDQPEFIVTPMSVVLDVVVRGRGHQPVTNLSADDFEVFDDRPGATDVRPGIVQVDEPQESCAGPPVGASHG
jgi:hypothetical protein